MKKHLKNLTYIFRHKWYVMVECFKVGLYWRGLVHDLSKFLPDEFIPYSHYFHAGEKATINGFYEPKLGTPEFNRAWLKHQHRNPHHWQFWILVQDTDPTLIIPIPDKYRREMLADWRGAGMAQGYGDNTREWYLRNREKIQLHPETRAWVEEQLGL